MPVDLAILKKHGCSAEAWRVLFETPKEPAKKKKAPKDNAEDPLCDVKERIRSRIINGRDYNLRNYHTIHALDLIWDTPFRQISPTLLSTIMGKYKGTEETLKALASYGFDLDSIMRDTGRKDPKTKLPIKEISVPAFFAVMVPLVRAYLKIRRARIINDRNRRPLIPYQPAINSERFRVKTEVVSNRIQVMAEQYDYLEVLNQSVFQMLLYPYCLTFTMEAWHYEEQLRMKGGKEEKYVTREGLRYHSPHPSRIYWDQAFSMKTFNTDTGCRWAGHWKVLRYGELKRQEGFYNLDRISIGSTDWWTGATNFFNSVYNTCVMSVPSVDGGTAPKDREQELIENLYYGETMNDRSVMFVEHREKVNPLRDKLGTYPHDIWARFVTAGDGTIIYAEPMGYNPVVCFKDNGDEKRLQDASLALELTPFQDQLSNLLTQYLYTVKQNLANLTLVDKNIFKKSSDGSAEYAELKKIKNMGEAWFRGLNIAEMDTKELSRGQYAAAQAFYSHRFPQMDASSILQAMKVVIDMAERVLQFSSQEVAQAATHEQTKAEVNLISGSTTNVLQYTGIPVDSGIKAMGEQNYDAWMNHGEDDFETQIPSDHVLTKEQLEEMGITLLEEPMGKEDKVPIKAKKSAVALLTFAFVPDNQSRVTDVEAAQAMATFVRDLMSNPVTAAAVGPKQAVSLANQIAKLAGIRLETKLRDTGAMPQEEAQQVLEQTINAVLPEVKKGIVPVMESIAETNKKVDMLYRMLNLPAPNGAPGQTQTAPGAPGAEAPILPQSGRMLPA